MFIKLTGSLSSEIIIINTEHIIEIVKANKSNSSSPENSLVSYINNDFRFIKETPEEILKLIESEEK